MAKPSWITNQGRITTEAEGSIVSHLITYSSLSASTAYILSGELPPGLTLSFDSVNTYKISGTIDYIAVEKEYFFTVRAQNSEGVDDLQLSILISNNTPAWLQSTLIGTFNELDYVSFQFDIDNPGGVETYKKIIGEIPEGIKILETGFLYGTIEEVAASHLYEFTMRAFLQDGTFIDKLFQIQVNNTISAFAPIWITPAGLIGNINNLDTSTLQVFAFDPNGDIITYSLIIGSLPPGLLLNPSTGQIQGSLSSLAQTSWIFTVRASDGTYISDREFIINTNVDLDASITWVTPSGSLGQLSVGDISFYQVEATSSLPIIYSLDSGTLPSGLFLNASTGEIYGSAFLQPLAVYTFTIKAQNSQAFLNRTFSIEIITGFSSDTLLTYLNVSRYYKAEWSRLLEYFEYNLLYKPYDNNFGLKKQPKINVIQNLMFSTKSSLETVLNFSKPLSLILGPIKKAIGRNSIGTALYEVFYREIIEINTTATDFPYPNVSTDFKNNTINIIRSDLTANPGLDGDEYLPLWMRSEQTLGDTSSVLGYFPCIEIAYLKPNTITNNDLLNLINDEQTVIDTLQNVKLLFNELYVEPKLNAPIEPFTVRFFNFSSAKDFQETVANNSPIFADSPGSLGTFVETDIVSIPLTATDPNLLTLIFTLNAGSLPAGFSLSGAGVISGVVDAIEGVFSFTVKVTNTNGYASYRSFSITTNQ